MKTFADIPEVQELIWAAQVLVDKTDEALCEYCLASGRHEDDCDAPEGYDPSEGTDVAVALRAVEVLKNLPIPHVVVGVDGGVVQGASANTLHVKVDVVDWDDDGWRPDEQLSYLQALSDVLVPNPKNYKDSTPAPPIADLTEELIEALRIRNDDYIIDPEKFPHGVY